MACLPPSLRPRWLASEGPAGTLRYPNGIEAVCFTAKAPEGPVSHQGDLDLYDDVAKWGPTTEKAWAHARYSCRVGYGCGIVATTRRGTHMLRKLLAGNMDGVLVRRPEDPRANRHNLTAKFFRQMEAELGDTDLYRQEIDDEDQSSGPFAGTDFEAFRVSVLPPDLMILAVWVDPATSSTTRSCEVGVVVVGLDSRGNAYAVEDCSRVMSAGEWPGVVLDAYERWVPRAPCHVGIETNKGGNMGAELVRQEERIRRLQHGMPGVSVIEIREVNVKPHDSKVRRAGPVANLAKAGQLKMMSGLAALEKQLRELDDTEGPKRDRADAFIHGVLDIALGAYPTGGAAALEGPLGPVPLGSINVGPTMSTPAPFQFGTPAGWR